MLTVKRVTLEVRGAMGSGYPSEMTRDVVTVIITKGLRTLSSPYTDSTAFIRTSWHKIVAVMKTRRCTTFREAYLTSKTAIAIIKYHMGSTHFLSMYIAIEFLPAIFE